MDRQREADEQQESCMWLFLLWWFVLFLNYKLFIETLLSPHHLQKDKHLLNLLQPAPKKTQFDSEGLSIEAGTAVLAMATCTKCNHIMPNLITPLEDKVSTSDTVYVVLTSIVYKRLLQNNTTFPTEYSAVMF